MLGDHVKQSGSLVSPERLRFDFTHYTAVTDRELGRVEELINQYIMENHPVETQVMDVDQAVATGAMALFDEKYGDKVRVVSVKDVSKELCGGTHTRASGDIGMFKLLSEVGIAAGVRRIEAVAGRQGVPGVQARGTEPSGCGAAPEDNGPRCRSAGGEARMPRPGASRKSSTSSSTGCRPHKPETWPAAPGRSRASRCLARRADGMDAKDLRDFGDKLRDKLGSGILALGSVKDDKVSLIVMVSKDLTGRFHAGTIIKELAPMLGGTGGGKPDMAQSGGKDPAKLDAALEALYAIINKG